MADPPFAPWGRGEHGLTDPRPWEVRQFGTIYRLLGAKNRDDIDRIDGLYIYEIAALLGVDEPKPDDTPESGVSRAVERMRRAQAGEAPPEPEAPSEGIIDLMRMGMG